MCQSQASYYQLVPSEAQPPSAKVTLPDPPPVEALTVDDLPELSARRAHVFVRPMTTGVPYELHLVMQGKGARRAGRQTGEPVASLVRPLDGAAFLVDVVAADSFFQGEGSVFAGTLAATRHGRLVYYAHEVLRLAGEPGPSIPFTDRLRVLHTAFSDADGFRVRPPSEMQDHAVAKATELCVVAGDRMPCHLCFCATPQCAGELVETLLSSVNPDVHPANGILLTDVAGGRRWSWSEGQAACTLWLIHTRLDEHTVSACVAIPLRNGKVERLEGCMPDPSSPLSADLSNRLVANGSDELAILVRGVLHDGGQSFLAQVVVATDPLLHAGHFEAEARAAVRAAACPVPYADLAKALAIG
jgi:hypothetical protein